MKLEMYSAGSPEELPFTNWAKILVGEERDDRGGEARKFAHRSNIDIEELEYNPNDSTYSIGGNTASVDDLSLLKRSMEGDRILIDATTVGFVELLLTIRSAIEGGLANISFCYVEPLDYSSQRTRGVLHARDFILSEDSGVFSAVPGSAIHLSRSGRRAILVVGYEGDRLQKVFEQTPIEPRDTLIMLGIPAFQAGWEMNSFANIVDELDERRIGETSFVGATNPHAVYREISRVHEACSANERLVIVPIGTKPHGLGAALYAAKHEEVGLVYDNPARKKGRTKDVGKWHLYEVAL